MANFRRSLVITFFSSSGATIVQFIVSLVLARLLSPSEIGVFSITVVFVNIAHMFRDFGVSVYLQREADLTTDKIRAAIGVLITTSWTIALLLFCASGWIAFWFEEPGIAPVMKVLALGFVFIPFGSVTHSLLVRQFAADKEAYVMAAGTTSYAICCLGLASLGFGTMSLAWANLANIVVCAIAYIPLRPKNVPWLPSFRHWRGVLHFGLGSLTTSCTSAINNAIPDILLGKLGGARQVGLLSRGNSTVTIFGYIAGATVNYGAVSYVSQAHHRGEPLTPLLNRAVVMLTGLGWPVLGATAVLGHEIVMTLYGAKWLESVPVIVPLAISSAVSMTFNYIPTAMTALGRPYLSAIPTALTIIVRLFLGLLLFDGTLRSFAWAICIATIAATPVIFFQQKRYLGYPPIAMIKATFPSAIVSIITTVSCYLLSLLFQPGVAPIINLGMIVVPLIVIWYISLRIIRHPLTAEVHHLARGLRDRLLRKSSV